MSNRAFVLDTNKKPLMPCTPKRARKMLEKGLAAVFKTYPFTIILKKEVEPVTQSLSLKIDPGSKTTGLTLVLHGKTALQAIWGAELKHRGHAIRDSLTHRRSLRSARRSRKLRHRPARFLNRSKPKGWLAPSLMHRVLTVKTWASRLDRWTPLDGFSLELVSFDIQKIMDADIQGTGYQKGTLFGTEIRAYLLDKWNGKCVYCGKQGTEIEHLIPKSKGGSKRISNLVLSCRACNEKKGTQSVTEFLKRKPALLKKITEQQQVSLADSSAVNSTKYRLLKELQQFGYPVETGSGAQTSFNRNQQGYDKAHWIDAACVGNSGSKITIKALKPLKVICIGQGNRQMCGTDKYGFPIRHRSCQKVFFGFKTGDICKAVVTTGKKVGTYTGRVTVRATGSFKLTQVDGINYRFFSIIQKGDGYNYNF